MLARRMKFRHRYTGTDLENSNREGKMNTKKLRRVQVDKGVACQFYYRWSHKSVNIGIKV